MPRSYTFEAHVLAVCCALVTVTGNAHHFGRLGAGDLELELGVLLPEAKVEGELGEEAIEGIAAGGERGGAGVAAQATFEGLARVDELLPVLELVGVGILFGASVAWSQERARGMNARLAG